MLRILTLTLIGLGFSLTCSFNVQADPCSLLFETRGKITRSWEDGPLRRGIRWARQKTGFDMGVGPHSRNLGLSINPGLLSLENLAIAPDLVLPPDVIVLPNSAVLDGVKRPDHYYRRYILEGPHHPELRPDNGRYDQAKLQARLTSDGNVEVVRTSLVERRDWNQSAELEVKLTPLDLKQKQAESIRQEQIDAVFYQLFQMSKGSLE